MLLNAAFYQFFRWPTYRDARPELLVLCRALELKGTILLSPEGINGNVCGPESAVRDLLSKLREVTCAAGLRARESWSEEPSFKRLKIRLKRKIIAMGTAEADPIERTGARLAPAELKRWLDENKDILLVDTRNAFEVREGSFRGALDLKLSHFHDFPERIETIREAAQGRPVVMFCTGGIRCERATAHALGQGLSEIFQLDGGILGYFEACGGEHYEGKCFVFDERETLEARCS